jgi:hypothetical protein
VIVSSQDVGPRSRATEIVIGGISTASTRRESSPVTHMLEPPSTSGPYESLLQSRPQTRGDVSKREMLATVVSPTWPTDACHRVGGGQGVSIRAWAKDPLGNSTKVDCGGGSGGGRIAACGRGVGGVWGAGTGLAGAGVEKRPSGSSFASIPSLIWHEPTRRFVPDPSHSTAG